MCHQGFPIDSTIALRHMERRRRRKGRRARGSDAARGADAAAWALGVADTPRNLEPGTSSMVGMWQYEMIYGWNINGFRIVIYGWNMMVF